MLSESGVGCKCIKGHEVVVIDEKENIYSKGLIRAKQFSWRTARRTDIMKSIQILRWPLCTTLSTLEEQNRRSTNKYCKSAHIYTSTISWRDLGILTVYRMPKPQTSWAQQSLFSSIPILYRYLLPLICGR